MCYKFFFNLIKPIERTNERRFYDLEGQTSAAAKLTPDDIRSPIPVEISPGGQKPNFDGIAGQTGASDNLINEQLITEMHPADFDL
ncbi:MAG: hypothetical protein PHY54_03270 [Methylococcales bacterium]|nr:hypothetical protein [Methylococcales bacterium]